MVAEIFDCEVLAPGDAAGLLCYLELAGYAGQADAHGGRDSSVEIDRLGIEFDTLSTELRDWVQRLEARGMAVEADVVRTHVQILDDRTLRQQIDEHVRLNRCSAEQAIGSVMDEMAARLSACRDSCISQRAADVRDLAAQLIARLDREQWERLPRLLEGRTDSVLAVAELYPSIVLKAGGLGIRAFVVERGTGVSHGAILAKGLGVPVVKTEPLSRLRPLDGRCVRVDGARGRMTFQPQTAGSSPAKAVQPARHIRSASVPVELLVNIVDPSQLDRLDWTGIAGIGLYRTETLFVQHHDDFPSERQQYETYRRLFELCQGRPVTIRTADIGGDKTVPYLSIGAEPNPYLGLRGPRLYRFHPDLITVQLRAILRAAAGWPGLHILYPMVNTIEDWRDLKLHYREAADSLCREGVELPSAVAHGPLVETPSAALSFARLLDEIDFASVGTNDLVQYLFAVDRNNANVAHLYQPEHPIVLGVLADLASRSAAAAKPLTICGEIASQTQFLPLLIGLGYRRLSVAMPAVPEVRRRLARLRLADCQELARQCLAAPDADAVRALLGQAVEHRPPGGMRVDPVCGMTVRTQGNPFTVWREGVRYSFCSRRCLLRFSESER